MDDARGITHDGQVTDVNHETQAVKVAYDDMPGYSSGWLQVMFPTTGKWIMTSLPRKGDQVKVLHNPNGREEGFVIGAPFTAGRLPQGSEDGVLQMYSDDGNNFIRFDAAGGTMQISIADGALFTFGGNLKIKCGSVDINATGVIKLSGSVEIDGDIKHTGDMQTSGVHTDRNGVHRNG